LLLVALDLPPTQTLIPNQLLGNYWEHDAFPIPQFIPQLPFSRLAITNHT
jgi:hypothetical protein